MNLQERAQKKVARLKSKRLKGWEIAELCNVGEDIISRVHNGRKVSDSACKSILGLAKQKEVNVK